MVIVSTISEDRRDYWDREVARLEMCHPLNAFGWGKVRAVDGWSPFYLLATRGGAVCGAAILLVKTIFPLPCSVLYMPRGPICKLADRETALALIKQAKEIARRRRAIFLRIDPNVTESCVSKENDPFTAVGFRHLSQRWTFWNSPCDVVRLNLEGKYTEDDLLRHMKKQARRGIQKALRQGVRVRQALNEKDARIFYSIFDQFAREKRFLSRAYRYHKRLWHEYISRGHGVLLLAEYNGQVVGGVLNLIFGRKCIGMHGAILSPYRHLYVNDLLEWEGIKWAKKKDSIWYSFRGAGPKPSHLSYKMKFGSELVPLIGYYDLPFYPLLYTVLHWIEFTILPVVVMCATRFLYFLKHLKR